jgi:sialate O-acetylesterase
MNMKKSVFLVVLMSSIYVLADVKLPAILSDHAVLQRDTKVRIWGLASSSENVSVQFRKQRAETQADAKGNWAVTLKPMKAGGPDDLTVTGKNTIIVKDVLVGEVWLCSGQSNMDMRVGSCRDVEKEAAEAKYPSIRQFFVDRRPMGDPTDEVAGRWVVCEPGSVCSFTGVGYFFARFLHDRLNVPVGILDSAWGGTAAESWTPLAALKDQRINLSLVRQYEANLPHFAEVTRQYQVAVARHEKLLKEGKLQDRHVDPGNKGFELGWAKSDFKDTDWKTDELPRMVDDLLGGDGAIWFRRDITIPTAWAGHPLAIHLGAVDDFDVTYWNGVKIGSTGRETPEWWVHPRRYNIPANLATAGKTIVAVRVFDDFAGSGFINLPEDLYVEDTTTGNRIPLAGTWRWKVEVTLDPAVLASFPSAPFGPNSPSAPSTLYNGMIHPLRNYPIRGAIWYQGEGNAGNYGEYLKLLTTMIREWRKAWNTDFPFGIVQLTNFMAYQPDPKAGSLWAGLRESQLKVSQTVPDTGLAVIIDIGSANDIHPKNKQDVGKRLGLWALAKVYGKWIEYAGPMYKSMKIKGEKIQVKFDHVGWGGLVAKGDKVTGFAIAGADGKFVWAEGKIEGDKVMVWSDKVTKPVMVRYAWGDNPVCNLYNKADLPACPFRTDK